MRFRKLANTGVEVSAIALGTWVFGGDCWGKVEDSQSVRVVEEAIYSGVNFIDTAPIYGSGRSEEMIGHAIKDRSDQVFIATKCGLEQKGSVITPNLSPAFIREEIENSLRRLKVERIDLYQCHWSDPNTPMEETFGEMLKLVKEGKIRFIGVSNFEKSLLAEALSIAPVVSDQMEYSLFNRDIEKDLMPFCREKGVSILAYGPLGGGILTGKYKTPPHFSKGDARSFFYTFYKEPFWSKARAFLPVLGEIAGKRQVPTSEVAINWVLSHSEVGSCIVGCRTPEQVAQNVAAGDWALTDEELAKIKNEYEKIFS